MDGMKIPVPFVNTYFYVKSMEIFQKVSAFLNKTEALAEIENRIKRKKKTLTEKYFDVITGDLHKTNRAQTPLQLIWVLAMREHLKIWLSNTQIQKSSTQEFLEPIS